MVDRHVNLLALENVLYGLVQSVKSRLTYRGFLSVFTDQLDLRASYSSNSDCFVSCSAIDSSNYVYANHGQRSICALNALGCAVLDLYFTQLISPGKFSTVKRSSHLKQYNYIHCILPALTGACRLASTSCVLSRKLIPQVRPCLQVTRRQHGHSRLDIEKEAQRPSGHQRSSKRNWFWHR